MGYKYEVVSTGLRTNILDNTTAFNPNLYKIEFITNVTHFPLTEESPVVRFTKHTRTPGNIELTFRFPRTIRSFKYHFNFSHGHEISSMTIEELKHYYAKNPSFGGIGPVVWPAVNVVVRFTNVGSITTPFNEKRTGTTNWMFVCAEVETCEPAPYVNGYCGSLSVSLNCHVDNSLYHERPTDSQLVDTTANYLNKFFMSSFHSFHTSESGEHSFEAWLHESLDYITAPDEQSRAKAMERILNALRTPE